ncbi:MAG TPA: hypothetical protein IGS17_03900 [Oscillatoriales cyanobacterium M59_W2019_021]|nr:hypothetical protein [Oscillatoriales cyanobacterium M4454_W2019_049]HIK50059.1 hypothetical protein [Oscillatoriales cyanobacterium M59_W2019_021]
MPYTTQPTEYSQRLYPWAIARLLPDLQQSIVGRFRTPADAEGHLLCLRRLIPNARFVLFFDRDPDLAPQVEVTSIVRPVRLTHL